MLLPPSLEEMIDAQKITDTLAKINEALKDKPVSKKVSQKLKYAGKNWPGNLEKYDNQEKILHLLKISTLIKISTTRQERIHLEQKVSIIMKERIVITAQTA